MAKPELFHNGMTYSVRLSFEGNWVDLDSWQDDERPDVALMEAHVIQELMGWGFLPEDAVQVAASLVKPMKNTYRPGVKERG